MTTLDDFSSFDIETQPGGSKRVYYLEVAELTSGDILRLAALVAKGAEPGPTLVALGGVHGDEYEGPHAVRLVFNTLDPEQMAGTSVISTAYGSSGKVFGGMGVLGPTRMDYPGTIANVAAVALYIGEVLGNR